MKQLGIFALTFVCLLLPTSLKSQTSAGACGDQAPAPVTDLGERKTYGVLFVPSAQPAFSVDPSTASDNGLPPIKYMRALITVRNPGMGQWSLMVRDAKLHAIEVLTPQSFGASGTHWTLMVPGSLIRMDFDNISASNGVSFFVEEYMLMRDTKRSYYSQQKEGAPDFDFLYTSTRRDISEDLKRLGDFTGFVISSYGATSWACSGVAVGPDLFLTNWHCGAPANLGLRDSAYWSKDICDSTLIDMSWDDDTIAQEYRCVEVVTKDIELDFALLRVRPSRGFPSLRPAPIALTLPDNKEVSVIHHPLAGSKKVSPKCAIEKVEHPSWRSEIPGTDFTHKCDTESGSSGAPVFNNRGELVGLHHWGFKYDLTTCQYTDKVNKAVRMDKIVEKIRANTPLLRVVPR